MEEIHDEKKERRKRWGDELDTGNYSIEIKDFG